MVSKLVAAIDESYGNYTACSEAVLCDQHDTPENRTRLEKRLWHQPLGPVRWDDCTRNDQCRCGICGVSSSDIIRNSYPDAKCPDCGESLPPRVVDGQACSNCGHVFCAPRDSDD